ncbi:MAG: 50S ribosomal protein L20 [Phycisphaerales bacterium]|nr:50S ribosomal protein L20 [Phycisphaerales bacterium]MCB9856410.1 50S ribosomal protein L20 [Phycisphaerales bacterium]MCB9864541.1 50S ribosomal protein L20 [Phycisphaerales bacterium]
MPRTRTHVAHHKRVKRIMKAAKGYYGARSKLLCTARDTVMRAGVYAFRDRRRRKGDFRRLWITRITAACRMRGTSYSRFMSGLNHAMIDLNRKMLSEIAIADPVAFDNLVAIAIEHAKTPAKAA